MGFRAELYALVTILLLILYLPYQDSAHTNSINHHTDDLVTSNAFDNRALENLKLNLIENSGFEEADSYGIPTLFEGWVDGQTTGTNAYTQIVANGNYAGYLEAQGVPFCNGGYQSNSLWYVLPSTPVAQLDHGFQLEFNWNVLSNPDIHDGAYSFIEIQLENTTYTRYLRYYLSISSIPFGNSSIDAIFNLTHDVGSWHHFDRNITADYIDVFGSGLLDIDFVIADVFIYIVSPATATDLIRLAIDDVSLEDGTSNAYLTNGDFESGDGAGWAGPTFNTPVYLTQSTDRTYGSYSLNMTSGVTDGSSANGRFEQRFEPRECFLESPGFTILRFDWKYDWTRDPNTHHEAFIQIQLQNQTGNYDLHFYFGLTDGWMAKSNNFTLHGTDLKDEWRHSEIDLYESALEYNVTDVFVTRLQIYLAVVDGGAASLLVDNLQLFAPAISDSGFELEWEEYPSPGWTFNSLTSSSHSNLSYSGRYSLNMTSDEGYSRIYTNSYIPLSGSDLLSLRWRLEQSSTTWPSYASLNLYFDNGTHLYVISYDFASAIFELRTNGTTTRILQIPGHNTTGVWHHFERNVTQDLIDLFQMTEPLDILQISIKVDTPSNDPTILLLDDFYFIDTIGPRIRSSLSLFEEQPSLTWFLSDDHPYSYSIYLDGTQIQSSPWYARDESIKVDLIEMIDNPVFELEIVAIDSGGNTNHNSLGVTLNSTNGSTPGLNPQYLAVAIGLIIVLAIFIPLTIKKWYNVKTKQVVE